MKIYLSWSPPATNTATLTKYRCRISKTAPTEAGGLWTETDYVEVETPGNVTSAYGTAADVGDWYIGVAAVNSVGEGPMAIMPIEVE